MYRNLIRLAVTTVAAAAIVFGRGPALAAAPPPTYDLYTVIENLRFWVVGIAGGIGTLFFAIGGIRYLTAGGDPSEIERAKGAFKSVGIGYGIAVLAPVFMTILNSILRP